MAWETSTRAHRLPPDWQDRRTKVAARAHHKCQATTHAPGCNRKGTEVDHIIQGDDHSLDNLQLLSTPCHKAKTTRENKARVERDRALRKRPAERHPGLL